MEELPKELEKVVEDFKKDIERTFSQLTVDQVHLFLKVCARHSYFKGVKEGKEWMLKEFNKKALETIKEGEE